ncbi:MAG: T9SS type A sorting domain-containing protein [Bacteroidota bacterium]
MRPLLLLAALVSSSVAAQPVISGVLEETSSGPYTAGDTYEVTLTLRSSEADRDLRDASIFIDYNAAALSFSASPVAGGAGDYEYLRYFSENFLDPRPSLNGESAIYSSNVARPQGGPPVGTVSINIDLSGSTDGEGAGERLPTEATRVVTLRFAVEDPGVDPGFSYRRVVASYTVPDGPDADPDPDPAPYTIGAFTVDTGSGTDPGVDIVLDSGIGWYFLSAPVEGATVGSFFAPLWTQGFTGSDAPSGPATVFDYDETVQGVTDDGFVSAGAASDPVPPGRGRFVYVFADDDFDGTPDPFPKTLTLTGVEPTLPFTFQNLTFTSTGSAASDGWTMLGNPVQDVLDWDLDPASGGDPQWTRTDLSDIVYVYDTATAEYLEWDASTNLGRLTGGEIPPGRGFWVQTTAANPVLTAPDDARVSGRQRGDGDATTEATAGASEPNVIELRFSGSTVLGARGSTVFLAFGVEDAAFGADPDDAYALSPLAEAYVLAGSRRDDGELVSINALPSIEDVEALAGYEGVIEMSVALDASGIVGPLEARWPQALDGVEGWTLALVDRWTGAEVDLRGQEAYTFDPASGADAQGRTADAGPRLADADKGMADADGRPRPLRMSETEAATPAVAIGLFHALSPDKSGRSDGDRFALRIARVSSVDQGEDPSALTVSPPIPNPAVGRARLAVALAVPAEVEVAVFDMLGRRVVSVPPASMATGRHDLDLDASGLSAGVYVVQTAVRAGSGEARVVSHKLTVAR